MKVVVPFLSVLCLILVIPTLSAQESKKFSLDQVTLRKSFQSKNDRAEAAQFTYTNPENSSESWLLNAALGINVLPRAKKTIELAPYLEYHRNTLVDKEQDNFQIGAALEWQLQELLDHKWTPILIASLRYNNDFMNEVGSFQGNYYFTPLFKPKMLDPKYFWLPNTLVNFGSLCQFVYTPYIGLENENRFETANSLDEGSIYRAVLRLSSGIYLFPKNDKLSDKFELLLDWQYRFNFKEDVESLTRDEQIFYTISFNYVFDIIKDEKKAVKVGFDYVNGENPTNNFEQQSFYAISLKIKL